MSTCKNKTIEGVRIARGAAPIFKSGGELSNPKKQSNHLPRDVNKASMKIFVKNNDPMGRLEHRLLDYRWCSFDIFRKGVKCDDGSVPALPRLVDNGPLEWLCLMNYLFVQESTFTREHSYRSRLFVNTGWRISVPTHVTPSKTYPNKRLG